MSNRRVVVTGLGVIAPNGRGLKEYETGLRAGKSGLRFQPELAELAFGCHVAGVPASVEDVKKEYFRDEDLLAMNSPMIFAGMAAIDAFKDAGLKVPAWDEDMLYEDTGAIIGTGIGGIETFAEKVYPAIMAKRVRRLGSAMVEQTMASAVSAKLSGLLALGNQVTTNSSACSTGTEAVIMGYDRIKAGYADRMVVGGTEGVSPFIWAGFDAMRVLSSKFNDTPEKASRPMSASSAGFVPGAGSGILVIESLEAAKSRGARIYAEILGASLTSGGMRKGGTMTAQSPYSVRRCIREAVTRSGISSKDIQYINGHLTATMADPYELGNWSAALERAPGAFPYINSTKSMIGHALGASGGLELVATVLQMHKNFVHPSINCEDFNEEIKDFAQHVPSKTKETEINYAAKASFGFGDVNSCIILKSWR
jgi:3-oxoacyl-(acyl-carrier-protein) synthase